MLLFTTSRERLESVFPSLSSNVTNREEFSRENGWTISSLSGENALVSLRQIVKYRGMKSNVGSINQEGENVKCQALLLGKYDDHLA